tara:strand:- start:153 stop:359 length:207 start_codon:yes stop_codon:yes gene_type:complete
MSIKGLVNDKNMWDSLNEELDSRINFYHKQMEILTDIDNLYRLQGEIKAIRSLKGLRNKINGAQTDTF